MFEAEETDINAYYDNGHAGPMIPDGSECRIQLTPDLVLHVCVDTPWGPRVAQVDLSPAMVELARVIKAMHGSSRSPAAIQDMATHADRVVQTAGIAIAGDMRQVWTGGLWDSIKSVYRTASAPVTFVNKNVAKVLQHLEPAVTIAATAVATAYGGPAAGAAASRMVGPILDSSAKTGGDPTRLFDQVKEKSGYHPTVVKAVDNAQRALTHTAIAYHAAQTADDAARGEPDAIDQLAQVEQAAAAGDQTAIYVLKILAEARQASGIQP